MFASIVLASMIAIMVIPLQGPSHQKLLQLLLCQLLSFICEVQGGSAISRPACICWNHRQSRRGRAYR